MTENRQFVQCQTGRGFFEGGAALLLMNILVLLKFSRDGQILGYGTNDPEIRPGDAVLAETGQGLAMGRVVAVRDLGEDVIPEDIQPVERRASAEDLIVDAENYLQVQHAREFCAARIRERGLDMKLVNVEGLFDRSKLLFYFTAPTRIDFRELVKELVREFHTRIELRQIGVRHETQMLGAVGSCGMVCCCRRFLHKFVPVTIKMAKEQNLFLNPSKISGICGRLLCCLSYEQDNYDAFHHLCPRLGKRYQTRDGMMKVLRANMFRNSISVINEKNEEQEFTLEEWSALNPCRPDAPAQAAPRSSAPASASGPAENAQNGKAQAASDFMVVVADPTMDEGLLDETLDSAFGPAEFLSGNDGQSPPPQPETPARRRRNRKK